MSCTCVSRAVLRRQLECMRQQRLPKVARRFESSSSTSSGATSTTTATKGQAEAATASVVKKLGPFSRFGQFYARLQNKRPYSTQLATSIFIWFCSDLTAQTIDGKEYDPWRTLRSISIGGIAAIPAFCWFRWLGTSPLFKFDSVNISIAARVAITQAVFTPTFNCYFFGSQALLSGEHPFFSVANLESAWLRIKTTVPVSIVRATTFWPAVTALNFKFIPLDYQFVFQNVMQYCWQTYLSFLNKQRQLQEERELAGVASAESVATAVVSPVIAKQAVIA
ncbi:hypothetical protein BX600DRAFT_543290 [Xylariales sp. PMI_506]|nr:hypothetical protein BX600DRAFT_543290 [Xylariales sp. PMI_506]